MKRPYTLDLREPEQDDEVPRDIQSWGGLNTRVAGTVFQSPATAVATEEGPPQHKLGNAHPGKRVEGVKYQVEVGPGAGKTLIPQRPLPMIRHNLGAPFLLASLEFCPRQALVENWMISPTTPHLLASGSGYILLWVTFCRLFQSSSAHWNLVPVFPPLACLDQGVSLVLFIAESWMLHQLS